MPPAPIIDVIQTEVVTLPVTQTPAPSVNARESVESPLSDGQTPSQALSDGLTPDPPQGEPPIPPAAIVLTTETICPMPMCADPCPAGYAKDERGCETCDCVTKPEGSGEQPSEPIVKNPLPS